MTMIDLTIKIRTNRPVSEVWAALEPVAGNVENITMSAEKVTRSYTKRKPKPKKIDADDIAACSKGESLVLTDPFEIGAALENIENYKALRIAEQEREQELL